MTKDATQGGRRALRVNVRGVVQGVGFRPCVYALAHRYGLGGWVRNTSAGVEVFVEGESGAVEAFAAALPSEAPPRSHIVSCIFEEAELSGDTAFAILASAADPSAYQLISPDLATCDACRRELLDPANRRFEYPFTNCTDCGPRFTIIEDLPYDRERTTMRRFRLCPACRREYEDPIDRRFHAEPNACPICGPHARLVRLSQGAHAGDGVTLAAGTPGDPGAPVRRAAELLLRGEIVAVKGLGGFHLACDATDGEAVGRLKARKRRPHKPFAVMLADVGEVRRQCRVTDEEEALLLSSEHPIVLLERLAPPAGRGAAPLVAVEVAVGQRRLGVMLPYTPLHILLLRAANRPLVMTSGNLADEPIVADWSECGRLAGVADAFLLHDRPVAMRCDDSVAVVRGGRPRLVRRARGYAPLPVTLLRALPPTLGCGAELKSAFCLTRERDAFLSQHIGDLENLETLEHYEATIEWFRRLFGADPEVVGYDLHPEYLATKFAQSLPQPDKVAVQHHHAHVAARLVEARRETPVIGVSMDGLGYGHDGTLWGGEILICDLLGYRRVAHLQELPLPGGKAAIRAPWRTALGWAFALLGEEGATRAATALSRGRPDDPDGHEIDAVRRQVEASVNVALTTSCGRLFDAVGALAGVRPAVTYEGQAAIELEALAAGVRRRVEPYSVALPDGWGAAATGVRRGATAWAAMPAAPGEGAAPPVVIGLAPLLAGVLDDVEAGVPAAVIGARLHATVAEVIVTSCGEVREATGLTAVALVGGVFQNLLLSGLCEAGLRGRGFEVLGGGLVPCNDGGVALGQAAVAGYTVLQRRGHLASSPARQD